MNQVKALRPGEMFFTDLSFSKAIYLDWVVCTGSGHSAWRSFAIQLSL